MGSVILHSARHLGLALAALLAALAMAAAVPSAAQAIPGGEGCDLPVVEETSEDFDDQSCAGELEEVTGVDTGGDSPPLPPKVEDQEDPISITHCARVRGTSSIRADEVDCATARSLAQRAGRRRQSFEALGFTCEVSGRKVTCYRRTVDPEQDNERGEEASQVVIVRTGDFPPRECRGDVC